MTARVAGFVSRQSAARLVVGLLVLLLLAAVAWRTTGPAEAGGRYDVPRSSGLEAKLGVRFVQAAVEKMRTETSIIVVDVHGETTSEKIALGRFLAGKVSAVLGTHTHVQTADEQIFPGGTAFLCDVGMCGPVNSIIGRAVEPIVQRFISNLPAQFPVATGEVRLRGALVEIDETTGRALRISRIDEAATSSEESQSEGMLENEYKNEQENG